MKVPKKSSLFTAQQGGVYGVSFRIFAQAIEGSTPDRLGTHPRRYWVEIEGGELIGPYDYINSAYARVCTEGRPAEVRDEV